MYIVQKENPERKKTISSSFNLVGVCVIVIIFVCEKCGCVFNLLLALFGK